MGNRSAARPDKRKHRGTKRKREPFFFHSTAKLKGNDIMSQNDDTPDALFIVGCKGRLALFMRDIFSRFCRPTERNAELRIFAFGESRRCDNYAN